MEFLSDYYPQLFVESLDDEGVLCTHIIQLLRVLSGRISIVIGVYYRGCFALTSSSSSLGVLIRVIRLGLFCVVFVWAISSVAASRAKRCSYTGYKGYEDDY